MDAINRGNAEHAIQFAHATKAETLALLRQSGAAAAAMVRGLGDTQLDRAGGSMGMTTVAIDMPGCSVAGATARFTLPEVAEHVSPLFAAIPLQFIGYYLARAFGSNPDQSQEVADPARFFAGRP